MTRPMFPHVLDATILATWRSCRQKAFRQYIQHWKPKEESVHLVAGGAFAKGIEVARRAFFEGVYEVPLVEYGDLTPDGNRKRTVTWQHRTVVPGNRESSTAAGLAALIAAYGDFECPPEIAKSLDRTAGALEFYFDKYPLGDDGCLPVRFPDGKYAIEFSFADPLPILHPVSGDPILYAGRADMIANFAGGVYIVDEKTTSSLGASWPRQWEMRAQFTGYTWAAANAGIATNGALVRGISILKTKYDTMQVPTYRPDWEVDRWLEQTIRNIQDMIACWQEGYWDWALDGACAEYGGCSLQRICKSKEPETWLPMYFEQRVWDPLERRALTVAEHEAAWGHDQCQPSTS